jgi:Arm DNA-binding domain/Phage integrase family
MSVRTLKPSQGYVTYWDDTTPSFGIRVGMKSKTWTIMRGRNRERVSIGRYPDISLAEARAEAKRLLSTIPDARSTPKTFAEAREEFLEQNYRESKSRHKHIVTLILRKHFKSIEHTQLVEVIDDDIRRALDKLKSTPSAQLHVYRAVRTFLTWCMRPPRRYVPRSPMEGYEPPGRDRRGTRVLTDDELVAVWNASKTGSKAIFRLLILWGTRNGETCCIERKWANEGVLTIPGDSTKNGRDHGIPILPLAQSVLDERPHAGHYYFQGRHSNNEHLTSGALNKMRAEIQTETATKDWQARDIRRTFRSNLARLKVPRDVCEVLINHAPPVLDEIYDRYDRLDEKREALAKYEAFMVGLLARG